MEPTIQGFNICWRCWLLRGGWVVWMAPAFFCVERDGEGGREFYLDAYFLGWQAAEKVGRRIKTFQITIHMQTYFYSSWLTT